MGETFSSGFMSLSVQKRRLSFVFDFWIRWTVQHAAPYIAVVGIFHLETIQRKLV